ncbi:hypothetical protein FO519_002192 [Halicephalobus sp. NKZ332]|nr:hypothetical protein FO519_002192 [Halicephalobus sp. NKZ332]
MEGNVGKNNFRLKKESGQGDGTNEIFFLNSAELEERLSGIEAETTVGRPEDPDPDPSHSNAHPEAEVTGEKISEDSHKPSGSKPMMKFSEISRLVANYSLQPKAKNFLRKALEGFIIDLLTAVEQDKFLEKNRNKGNKKIKVDEKVVRQTILNDHEFSSIVPFDEIRRKIPRKKSPIGVNRIEKYSTPEKRS